ncbi:class I SAM-dependent methyltransferase [Nostoc sp.]|uniref:class I SAM-dependent methyltransferase n=1 Tax=Nostoc sp. TaxID=1180 RepID=UPI002FF93B3B
MLKLHIGCGEVYIQDWINIDVESSKADLKHDLRQPLPYENNTVDLIYNEHFIEHLTAEEGVHFLKEMHRILKPGGVIRIATPDLDYLVFKYWFKWKKQDWIERYGYSHIETKAEMMNAMFHYWGHKWLYNFEELKRRLIQAEFRQIKRVSFRNSQNPNLQDLETRKDSKLIVESAK